MDSIVKKLFENRKLRESEEAKTFEQVESELLEIDADLDIIERDLPAVRGTQQDKLLDQLDELSAKMDKLISSAETSERISDEEWEEIGKMHKDRYLRIEDIKNMPRR